MDNDLEASLGRIEFSERNARKDPGREVDIRARQRMSADSKLTYGDALRQVLTADEDLARVYVNFAPPMR